MTELDEIRGELKRVQSYDPDSPIRIDLVLQVVNDLAIKLGVDGALVVEALEALGDNMIGSDRWEPGKGSELVMQALFDVLAPYQSGKDTRPSPIDYVSVRLPEGIENVLEAITLIAVQECGWPAGTYAIHASGNFELNYELKDRRAYILSTNQCLLIPRYNDSLSGHIERRDGTLTPDVGGFWKKLSNARVSFRYHGLSTINKINDRYATMNRPESFEMNMAKARKEIDRIKESLESTLVVDSLNEEHEDETVLSLVKGRSDHLTLRSRGADDSGICNGIIKNGNDMIKKLARAPPVFSFHTNIDTD